MANYTPDPFGEPEPAPASEQLFADTPTRKPHRAPRQRSSVSILQIGDVVAAGLTNGAPPVGQVSAVDDYGLRLDLYSWLDGSFGVGVAVILWQQVAEFKLAQQGSGGVYEMDPLAEFQTEWTKASK